MSSHSYYLLFEVLMFLLDTTIKSLFITIAFALLSCSQNKDTPQVKETSSNSVNEQSSNTLDSIKEELYLQPQTREHNTNQQDSFVHKITDYTMEEHMGGWASGITDKGCISGPTDPDPKRVKLTHYCDSDSTITCHKEMARLIDIYIKYSDCVYMNKIALGKEACNQDMSDVNKALTSIKFYVPPRLPPKVLWDENKTAIKGSLPQEKVLRKIKIYMGTVRYVCRRNTTENEYSGTLSLKMKIGKDGTVIEAIVIKSTSDNPLLDQEILNHFKKIQFEKSNGETNVEFAMEFLKR